MLNITSLNQKRGAGIGEHLCGGGFIITPPLKFCLLDWIGFVYSPVPVPLVKYTHNHKNKKKKKDVVFRRLLQTDGGFRFVPARVGERLLRVCCCCVTSFVLHAGFLQHPRRWVRQVVVQHLALGSSIRSR